MNPIKNDPNRFTNKVPKGKLGKKAFSKHIEIREKSNLDHVMREMTKKNPKKEHEREATAFFI